MKRLEFARQLLQKLDQDPDYLTKILCTHGSFFSMAEVFKRKNGRPWENKEDR